MHIPKGSGRRSLRLSFNEEKGPSSQDKMKALRGPLPPRPKAKRIKLESEEDLKPLAPFVGALGPLWVRPAPLVPSAQAPNKKEKKFTCAICGRGVGTRGGLVYHVRAHLQGRRFGCDRCARTYATQNDLDTHKKRHSGATFECGECGKHFTTKQYLLDHIRTCHFPKTLSCPRGCGKMFTQAKYVGLHIRFNCSPRGPLVGVCKFCRAQFYQLAQFKAHAQRALRMEFVCANGCEAKFSCFTLLRAHLAANAECRRLKMRTKIKCKECGAAFETEKQWNAHFAANHRERRLCCDVCPFATNNPKLLYYHKKHCGTHAQIRQLGFRCAPCDWHFRFESQLRKHLTMVHGANRCRHCLHGTTSKLSEHLRSCKKKEMPFRCIPCDVRFAKKTGFNVHFFSHQHHLSKSNFICDFCKDNFGSLHQALHHILLNHLNARGGVQCHFCGLKLASKESLTAHITKTHFPRTFSQCPDCNKGFFSEEAFRVHRPCRGPVSFKCEHCGLRTTSAAALKNHAAQNKCSPLSTN